MRLVYQTTDKAVFYKKEAALRHEEFIKEVLDLQRMIVPRAFLTSCDFSNGAGYVQLSEHTFGRFMQKARQVIKRHHPSLFSIFDQNPRGIVGRYLCDMESPAYILWGLICRIDKNGRLYGQQYFANHPNECKLGKLANV